MTTHDELAYAVASAAVGQIRQGIHPWTTIFSPDVYVTSSRTWPVPDFVLHDNGHGISAAAEFKPPDQTKREYLTGLGQAIAYSREFDYGVLVLPEIANDNYRIADHVVDVLSQNALSAVPIAVLAYDPSAISSSLATFRIARFFATRSVPPLHRARLDQSFYAKWREASPMEIGRYLEYLYEEGVRPSQPGGTIRDRAFERLWKDIQRGEMRHWAGGVRHAGTSHLEAWRKNYRNFISHLGWVESKGALTASGLKALHVVHIYGAQSRLFIDTIAQAVLLFGKHLILLNAINGFQTAYRERRGPFASETEWLELVERHLEDKGLLKRNPGRSGAAVQQSRRQFLKAEKQLWRNLDLLIPHGSHGGRVYHPGLGIIFNWNRIVELVRE